MTEDWPTPPPHKYWTLDESGQPVECDMMTWARDLGKGKEMAVNPNIVARLQMGRALVSTVFLGLNHNWGDGPPLIWETMVFKGRLDQEQDRCSGSRADALAMHLRMVERVSKEGSLWAILKGFLKSTWTTILKSH